MSSVSLIFLCFARDVIEVRSGKAEKRKTARTMNTFFPKDGALILPLKKCPIVNGKHREIYKTLRRSHAAVASA